MQARARERQTTRKYEREWESETEFGVATQRLRHHLPGATGNHKRESMIWERERESAESRRLFFHDDDEWRNENKKKVLHLPRARSSFFFFLFFFFIIFYFFFVIVRSPSSFCGFVFLQYTHTHFELSFSFFVSFFFGRSPHKYKEKIQTHSPLRLQLLQFKTRR